MTKFISRRGVAALGGFACLLFTVGLLWAQQGFTSTFQEVNKKLVKLYGAGGWKGLPSYGTGILVSKDGYILTVNNHILTTVDLRVHLYDGRQYHAKVVSKEPELDIALCKIEEPVDNLPHFDLAKEAAGPLAEAGDWILAFSNQFSIAVRDEPMSVQRGVVAAYADLRGRRGIFDAPYNGKVYFLDVIACNPGAAGGAVTTHKGALLGIIGRELKNVNSDTWINYAVPIQAKAEILRDDNKVMMDIPTFVRESIAGKYRSQLKKKDGEGGGGYHGIVLVPNVVDNTPPYVEEVIPNSPAAKAGLRQDDLIVYIDGELVPNIITFRKIVKNYAPGNEMRLDVQRSNRLHSLTLKLTEMPKGSTP